MNNSPRNAPWHLPKIASDLVYLIGARDDRWTLEALDWETGKSAFQHGIGGERFNPLFSGTHIDAAGRIHYATSWGRAFSVGGLFGRSRGRFHFRS